MPVRTTDTDTDRTYVWLGIVHDRDSRSFSKIVARPSTIPFN